jgi:hypothetical protein
MDVWEYFGQREREAESLSLSPFGPFVDMVAEEEGSDGQRGRMFGVFDVGAVVQLHVSELVVVEGNHIHREEYAYYLTSEGDEICGYERDPTHDPVEHRHTGPGHAREPWPPISFREVAELAWEEVSRQSTSI